jgi:elongation factor 1-gamma
MPYSKATFTALIDRVMGRLTLIDGVLMNQTYLVGERLTLADICLVTNLTTMFKLFIDGKQRVKIPNVVRLVDT